MSLTIRAILLASVTALSPAMTSADGLAGAYLAAQQAEADHDYAAAARYYARALALEPGNPELMESLTMSQILQGDFDRAVPIAETIEASGQKSQVAHMVVTTDLARQGEYETLIERTESGDFGIGPLVDGLVAAWARLGLGETDAAIEAFDALAEEQGLRGFAQYHKALALAQSGDYEAANAILSDERTGVQLTRRGAMARAEVQSQLGQNDAALAGLEDAFGRASDPGIAALRDRLEAGETVAFTHVLTARDGMAEVFYSIAAALTSEAQADYTLLYARMAQALRPEHSDALLLTAELLDELGQHELAIEAFAQMPRDHVDYHAAELGRIGALRSLERYDAAIEALKNLAKTHGDLPVVYSTLGDVYRQQDRFAEATEAYDMALARTDDDARGAWFLHYARAITLERQDRWEEAEAGFRHALELEPDQPQVLNYLGYSLVEKQTKLDEALEMIERAVAARPDSGYIVDSLGWVLYRLGRYDEAVGHMERAVELMPVDPVVNDHLGDVYWAVGRKREAEFQWSRALSLIDRNVENTDTEADPDRIRRKLSKGLDAVLAEEGAAPLKVADDN
jgi:tetratricopeptide (TPR) repeat protein